MTEQFEGLNDTPPPLEPEDLKMAAEWCANAAGEFGSEIRAFRQYRMNDPESSPTVRDAERFVDCCVDFYTRLAWYRSFVSTTESDRTAEQDYPIWAALALIDQTSPLHADEQAMLAEVGSQNWGSDLMVAEAVKRCGSGMVNRVAQWVTAPLQPAAPADLAAVALDELRDALYAYCYPMS